IFRKQRQGPRSVDAVFQHLNRLAPRQLLRGIDLPEIQHVPLHHATTAHALVLNKAPGAVLLAVLPANLSAQEHDAIEYPQKSANEIAKVGTTALCVLLHATHARKINDLPKRESSS